MREIKFRAWDGEKLHPLFVIHSQKGCAIFNGEFKDWNLMQYTGLKDKNGVEIYEGDIVKTIATDEYHSDNIISDVIYNETGEWQVREPPDDCEYNHGLPLNWGGWETLEVIGNIYENPELCMETLI